MSQINANSIYDASGGQSARLYGVSMRNGGTGWVNRIINGDMRIDQRNAGASVTGIAAVGALYTLDRWIGWLANVSTANLTVQQSSIAPPGFTNSLGVTITAAQASLSSGFYSMIWQRIEGFNVADLGWGAAGAQSVTLSFWVRSSVTGQFGGSLLNSSQNRSYPFAYTISAANTWEQKTITVPGDTSGTWLTNNSTGLILSIGLALGSNSLATANAWGTAAAYSATGQTNLYATNGATFFITGVQLEAGSVATPFERRDYGRELMMCQRYLPVAFIPQNNYMYAGQVFGATNAQVFIPFAVIARTAPTGITAVGSPQFAQIGGSPNGSVAFQAGSTFGASLTGNGLITGFTAGQATSLVTTASGGAQIFFNGCEL